MFDPERVGPGKSFVMAGVEAGYDMSNQEEMNAFMQIYNRSLMAEMHGQDDPEMGLPIDAPQRERAEPSKEPSKQKKRRKMAKASRRTNRKPKKKKKKKPK